MDRKNDSLLISELVNLLAEDTEYPLDGTLLYAQLSFNVVAPSIFKDRGNYILYREPDLNRLGDTLLDLWDTFPADKRWVEVEYFISAGKFNLKYGYTPINREEPLFDHRNRVVSRYFGDKPIVYPPREERRAARYKL